MVTSGSSRQSSRPLSVAGFASSASRSADGRKGLRDFVGMDRDQADRFFARQRAEPFLDLAGGQSETARAHQIDADEIAVLGAAGVGLARCSVRGRPVSCRPEPAARRHRAALRKIPSSARLRVIDDLDDAAAIGRCPRSRRLLDAQQRAVADAGGGARLRPARHMDADFRRGAVFLLVPFGRALRSIRRRCRGR